MTVIYKGQRLEYIKDFHGREVLWIMNPSRYLDKLVDELAKGKPMEKIKR